VRRERKNSEGCGGSDFLSTQHLASIYLKENAQLVKDVTTTNLVSRQRGDSHCGDAQGFSALAIPRIRRAGRLIGIVKRAYLFRTSTTAPVDLIPCSDLKDAPIRNA
jgi:hypothetical protein